MRYIITIQHHDSRTQDIAISASSAYQAGWLYRQLNPLARIISIRPAPNA